MEQIYSAELINNQIHWLKDKPKRLYKNRKYKVRVIIDRKEENTRTGRDLVESFRNSPIFGFELDIKRDQDPGRIIEL